MEENQSESIPSPTPPVVDTETLPVSQLPKPPFGSWWKIGVLVLGAVVLAGGLFFAGYQYSQKQVKLTVPPSTSPTPTPDPTANPDLIGANWKTYTNTKYSYEIKYPESSKVKESEGNLIAELLSTFSIDIYTSVDTISMLSQTIRVWKNLGVHVVDTTTRNQWCKLLTPKLVGQLDCDYEAKLSETQFANRKAFKASGGRDNSFVEVIYIPYSDYIYQIEWIKFRGDPNSPTTYPISTQTLSTFKFTK